MADFFTLFTVQADISKLTIFTIFEEGKGIKKRIRKVIQEWVEGGQYTVC